MIIKEKTPGVKIPYELMGDLLILDKQLYLNLPVYQRDFPVSLDISRNEYGMIVMGLSRSYVAQIDIPAREYDEVETGKTDDEGNPIKEMVARPFSLETVTLTLWGVAE
jgi:hypothetical protein